MTDDALNLSLPQEQGTEEARFDMQLRPLSLEEYVGQSQIKESLAIFLMAAKQRSEPLEHVLLSGPPGLGKTTLAHIIAREMGVGVRVTSGPALERTGDLAAILTNVSEGDILFIDEIHRLPKTIAESLYPAMEDFALDIIVGKGPTARTLRLNLERFTIIGATTRLSLLSAPLRDRFGMIHQIEYYEDSEIGEIVERNAKRLQIDIEKEAGAEIAKRARKTPRIANRLLRRVRDFAFVKADGKLTNQVAKDALALLLIDEMGLDATDRLVLKTIMEKFHGGPVGLSTISAATQQELETIEEVVEPFLIQLGLLERTPRGRLATKRAYEHLSKINQT